jgi:hypothetical protein
LHPANTEVWREKAFQVVAHAQHLRGVFDRVLLYRDAATGAITGASVVDFKLGDGEGQAQQLQEYAAALQQMLSLPESAIERRILEL